MKIFKVSQGSGTDSGEIRSGTGLGETPGVFMGSYGDIQDNMGDLRIWGLTMVDSNGLTMVNSNGSEESSLSDIIRDLGIAVDELEKRVSDLEEIINSLKRR